MPTVTPTYKTVQDLLKDEKFSIDDYQREYKWEKKQIDELINDLTSKFFSDYKPEHETKAVSNYDNYFLGSIIVSRRNGGEFSDRRPATHYITDPATDLSLSSIAGTGIECHQQIGKSDFLG